MIVSLANPTELSIDGESAGVVDVARFPRELHPPAGFRIRIMAGDPVQLQRIINSQTSDTIRPSRFCARDLEFNAYITGGPAPITAHVYTIDVTNRD